MQTEQTEQQVKEVIAKLLTPATAYRYNDADQREAGLTTTIIVHK